MEAIIENLEGIRSLKTETLGANEMKYLHFRVDCRNIKVTPQF